VRPARIVEVLHELNADIVALQEVLSIAGRSREEDQAPFISGELGLQYALGENRHLRGGSYGNVVLSRFPIRIIHNYDLSISGYEERGCLRADIEWGQRELLHVFNVHLGTAYMERRHQGRKLLTSELLNDIEFAAPRIVLGDFNEWTRGLATRLLSAHLESADVRKHLRRTRTYPGVMPLWHLDHIYYDPILHLERLVLHRSRRALLASDHLPLMAEFRIPPEEAPSTADLPA
jgi:endonuclease/exonuclease/phosphatase family metal-dependent hydrolase